MSLTRMGAIALVTLLAGIAIAATVSSASLLGRLTQGSRTFLALFLFGLYLNVQKTGLPALDMLGLSGAATMSSVGGYALAGVLGVALLHARSPSR